MTDHFTGIERRTDSLHGDKLRAQCPEHGQIGNTQDANTRGFNAVMTEARAHDDVVHGVYRSELVYLESIKSPRLT